MDDVVWLPTPLAASRVRVRRPRPGDEPALARLYADPDVRRFIGGPLDASEAQRRATQLVTDNDWGTFVIAGLADGATIGSGDIRRKRGPWELSFQLATAYWGQGLGSEAISALVTWFFAATSEERLIAVAQAENHRSSRLLERNGARLTGTFGQYGVLQQRYEFHRHDRTGPSESPRAAE
jgi:RimJ/RimL family protein N-acetyltransferase